MYASFVQTLLAKLKLDSPPLPFHPLRFKAIAAWMLVAAVSFQAAYELPGCACLILVFQFALLQLARVRTSRQAMNIAWVLGPLIYGPQLVFFWTVFGPGAITLWLVLAFWLGAFLLTLRQAHLYLGRTTAAVLAPILWMGFEFFRGELYYLRFTWLSAGFVFSDAPRIVALLGMYGIGFVLMSIASSIDLLVGKRQVRIGLACLLVLGLVVNLPAMRTASPRPAVGTIRVAGVQLEFPGINQVRLALDKLLKRHPEADLYCLSEYTFDGPVPETIRNWCRAHGKYLVAGGKDFADETKFRNTAYVIGTNGETVFQQVKAVPIQFFKDGLPALDQKVWNSPWGRIGLATCYDLSYSRVVDELARQGAQAIINPTMDVEDWGERQHRLHSRVPILRASEYGLPIFRVASSGVSIFVASDGHTVATAPFAREEAMISGDLHLVQRSRSPWDRIFSRICVAVTAACVLLFIGSKTFRWIGQRSRRTGTTRRTAEHASTLSRTNAGY